MQFSNQIPKLSLFIKTSSEKLTLSEVIENIEYNEYQTIEEAFYALKNAGAENITIEELEEEKYIVFGPERNRSVVDGDDVDSFDSWIYNFSDDDLERLLPSTEEDFWDNVDNLSVVYHATMPEYIQSIKEHGLNPENKTRGISNRGTGPAVFASFNIDAIESYGEAIIEINLGGMKKDGYTPPVDLETGIDIAEMRNSIAHKFKSLNYFVQDEEPGISEETIVIHGNIPTKYLKILN